MSDKCRSCMSDFASAENHNRYCANCTEDKQHKEGDDLSYLKDNFRQKPREYWVVIVKDGSHSDMYKNRARAESRQRVGEELILVREVMDD